MARTYLQMNKGQNAAAELKLLLKDDPNNAMLQNLRAVAFDLQGKHLEAQKQYRSSLALESDQRSVQSNLGLSLAFSGDYQEAISLLEEVRKNPTSTPKDRHNLEIAYALSGDIEKLESIFRVDLSEEIAGESSHYLANITSEKLNEGQKK